MVERGDLGQAARSRAWLCGPGQLLNLSVLPFPHL